MSEPATFAKSVVLLRARSHLHRLDCAASASDLSVNPLAVVGEGFEDLVGALVPDKRFGIVVPVGDPGAISRYALGDCRGLTYNDDGSLTLYIQRDRPDAPSDTNW